MTKKFVVGNFLENQDKGGWFYGGFISKQKLEYDERVEVSVKILPKGWGLSNEHPLHYHKFAKELGLVMRGEVRVEINGQEITLKKGDYYVLAPGCREKYLEVMEELELVTLKIPSVANDKIIV